MGTLLDDIVIARMERIATIPPPPPRDADDKALKANVKILTATVLRYHIDGIIGALEVDDWRSFIVHTMLLHEATKSGGIMGGIAHTIADQAGDDYESFLYEIFDGLEEMRE